MGVENRQIPRWAAMEPEKRIEELEREVQTLRGMVRQLLGDRGISGADSAPLATVERRKTPVHEREPALIRDILGRIDHAIGGGLDDTLETHIGAVWLGRLAIVAILTAFALGARATLLYPGLSPAEKVGIGYGASLCLACCGLIFRRNYALYAHALVGCGLAGLYFTTFAACSIGPARIEALAPAWLAFPLISASLILIVLVSHAMRSPSVAGIGLLLAYYTVALSSRDAAGLREQIYALFTCAEISLAVMLVFVLHGWRMLSWAAVAGAHVTYYVFFLRAPEESPLSTTAFFWMAFAFYSLSFVMLSLGTLLDARRHGPGTRYGGALALSHSLTYLALAWISLPAIYSESEWVFRCGLAGVFALLTFAAWITGGHRGYLMQLYGVIGAAVLAFALATALPGHKLPLALAVEGFALGLASYWTRLPVCRVAGLGLLLSACYAALAAQQIIGSIRIGAFTLSPGEFGALGLALIAVVTAWFYEVRCAAAERHAARPSGALLFGKTIKTLTGNVMAMLHAASAALVLLVATISERGDMPGLPYLLAAEGVALALAGLACHARTVAASSALLLAGSHVVFYVFLALPLPGFSEQYGYAAFTAALSLLTFGAAFLWERYLRELGGAGLERHLAGVLPYAAATLLLAYLADDTLPALAVPGVVAALGALLMTAGARTTHYSPAIAGLLAVGLGSAKFLIGIHLPERGALAAATFFPLLVLLLGAVIAAERALKRIRDDVEAVSPGVDGLRFLLVAAVVVLGITGLGAWFHTQTLVLGLVLLALALMGLGMIIGESRYRWAALAVFGVMAARTFLIVRGLTPPWQVLSFGAAGAAMLLVSALYARHRVQQRRASEPSGTSRVERHEPT